MKAAVLHGIKNIRIDEIKKPVIGPDEVLIKVKCVGVCGSDLHYYLNGRIGNQVVKGPHILGHEVSGEIVEVGSNVTNINIGMRVAVEPGIPCGECEYCKTGRYNICPYIKFLATPPTNGGYCEYLTWHKDFIHSIPDSMSYAEGALVETMVVGLYAVELSELKLGDNIAILGCGPIGVVTLKSAIASGANRIFVTDLIDDRLKFVRKYSNVVTINASRENPVDIINRLTDGRGVDIVFEAASSIDTLRQATEIVRIGGKVIWIGIPPEDYVSINAHIVRRKELVIKCVRRFKHNYRKCISLIESGIISVKEMVTHEFKLEDIVKAFSIVETRSDGVIKAIINI